MAAPQTKLWIGNLGPEVTEYSLLKLLQPFGRIEKFDMIQRKSNVTKSRPNFCFVSFENAHSAANVKIALHGKQGLIVRAANPRPSSVTFQGKRKPPSVLALACAPAPTDKVRRIRDIEAKLREIRREGSNDVRGCSAKQGSVGRPDA